MIERTQDAAFINEVLNHPDVRDDVAALALGELDLSRYVANPENICLVGEHGFLIALKIFPGCYEVHAAILPRGRGEWTRGFAEYGAHLMFTATDCAELLARVPEGHVATVVLTRAMGFRQQFTTLPECRFRGKLVPCSVWSLGIQDWGLRVPGAAGAEFLVWLDSHTGWLGRRPDPAQERVLGIALDMLKAGEVIKALAWYARWAAPARRPPLLLIGASPVQIKFEGVVLTLEDGRLRLERTH